MRQIILILGVLFGTACGEIGACIGTALGSAIGQTTLVMRHERDKDPARPAEAEVTSTTAYVSLPTTGGRLGVGFTEPLHTTAIPHLPDDGGCGVQDFGWFLPNGSPDAGTVTELSGHVTVVVSERVDGGTHLVMDLTRLKLNEADGGSRSFADQHVDLVAP